MAFSRNHRVDVQAERDRASVVFRRCVERADPTLGPCHCFLRTKWIERGNGLGRPRCRCALDNLDNLKLDAGRCVLVVGLRAAQQRPLAPIGIDCVVLSSTTPGAPGAPGAPAVIRMITGAGRGSEVVDVFDEAPGRCVVDRALRDGLLKDLGDQGEMLGADLAAPVP